MNSKPVAVFDNFNAKFLPIQQLVEGFIVNVFFLQLAGQNHTLLLGPRGSGKTTLLKMLQVEVLANWQAAESDSVKHQANFTGVFVPTDIVWFKQYRAVLSRHSDPVLLRSLVGLFVYHVLECLSDALEFRVVTNPSVPLRFKQLYLSAQAEADLVEKLAAVWRVNPEIASFRSLKDSVSIKSHEIVTLFNGMLNSTGTTTVPPELAAIDFSSSLATSIKLINNAFSETDGKWCFLFDELELAPEAIKTELIDLLRGGNPNMLFKLSLAPYVNDLELSRTFYSPLPNQDFTTIELTRSDDAGIENFAEKLCSRVFQSAGFNGFFRSYFQEPESVDYGSLFTSLAKKDTSFSRYLNQHGIEPSAIPSYSEKNKLPTVRRMRWVTLIRNHHFSPSTFKAKSNKRAADFYGGFSGICQALEYNPRMLIGTMNRFLQRISSDGKITLATQIEVVQETESAFSALLNTIPISLPTSRTLAAFVDQIGSYVASIFVLGVEFNPEPKGSFQVDDDVRPELSEAVRLALNTGALIRSGTSSELAQSLGAAPRQRFRLSRLFSHKYKLPMNVLRPMNLEEIFYPNVADSSQLDLL